MAVHLVKMAVGAATVDDIRGWHIRNRKKGPGGTDIAIHVTRNHPRRAEELLDGGSLYWIVKGYIRARNPIVGLVDVETEKGIYCGIQLAVPLVEVVPRQHRPIQGWRYFEDAATPPDLKGVSGGGDDLPPDMAQKLNDMGLL